MKPATLVKLKVCSFALVLAALAPRASAQVRMEESCNVRGSIHNSTRAGTGLIVELRGAGFESRMASSAYVDPSGSFQMSGVAAGQYTLMVKTQSGVIVHQEYLTVRGDVPDISIQLPESATPNRPAGGTVSAMRLRHKVPGKASKEFDKAEKAAKKGDLQLSIEFLNKALEIDPEYMEAHNNLGSRYMRTEQYDKALMHLEKACALDPGSSLPQINLATVLIAMKRSGEAEKAARRAVDLDPSSAQARFTLAVTLLELKKDTKDALVYLERSASDIPSARLLLAKYYAKQGDAERVKSELGQYLASGQSYERENAQKWLSGLESGALSAQR